MKNYKKWMKLSSLGFAVIFVGLLTGCATTSQVKELQMKVDQALQEARHATDMAKETESKCKVDKTDANEEYKAVRNAADRAENAAQRAEDAAKRAETAAGKTQELYDKIISK